MGFRTTVLATILVFVSFVLERLSVHGLLSSLAVPWVAMSVAFLVLQAPARVSYVVALFLGLLLDVEQMQLLGFNMLNLIVLVSLLNIFHHRLMLGGWPLVLVAVPLLIFIVRLISYAALWVAGGVVAFDFWLPLLALLLIWPLYYAALQSLRIQLNLI